jgi:hypothetical protein
MVFRSRLRGLLPLALNSDNTGCSSNTGFQSVAEACEEFYDTLPPNMMSNPPLTVATIPAPTKLTIAAPITITSAPIVAFIRPVLLMLLMNEVGYKNPYFLLCQSALGVGYNCSQPGSLTLETRVRIICPN